jgi:hypothetical protein
MQPSFQCTLKKGDGAFCCSPLTTCWVSVLHYIHRCRTHDLPRRPCSSNHCKPSDTEITGLFFIFSPDTKSKGQKLKNPATKQRSSPQGCTVRPETSAGQSSLGLFRPETRSSGEYENSYIQNEQ